MRRLAACAAFLALAACSARKEVESQVIASLHERIRAAGGGAVVDSLRLGPPQGAVFAGRVYLSAGEERESDSIVVKAGLTGIEYGFPDPGPLVSRLFR